MKKIIIMISVMMLMGCSKSDNNYYLIKPNDIIGITQDFFICYGRTWDFQKSLKPEIKDGVLFYYFEGAHTDWHSFDYHSEPPERNYDPDPIPFTGKRKFVIELYKKIPKDIFFDITITTNESYIIRQRISAHNKSSIILSLPASGKSLEHITIYFVGEAAVIGIKSIYLE